MKSLKNILESIFDDAEMNDTGGVMWDELNDTLKDMYSKYQKQNRTLKKDYYLDKYQILKTIAQSIGKEMKITPQNYKKNGWLTFNDQDKSLKIIADTCTYANGEYKYLDDRISIETQPNYTDTYQMSYGYLSPRLMNNMRIYFSVNCVCYAVDVDRLSKIMIYKNLKS